MSETETDWTEQALCASITTDLWFDYPPQAAVNVCNECPARIDCLQWALQHNETLGVWGGWTEQQRAQWLEWPQRRVCIVCGERSQLPKCPTC